jgi:photosystem II stability/assembly factor-like uncharacterized protein
VIRFAIFAAALLSAIPTMSGPVVHAIFRSTDQGRTWSRSDRGVAGGARLNAFGSVAGRVLAGTDSGVFVSDDAGQNWRCAGSSQRMLAFATLGLDV